MTHARTSVALACLALGGLATPAAFAQDAGWYAGAGIGSAATTVDDERIRNGLLNQGLDPVSMAEDEREAAYRLFGGYQFNRHFGVEAGWFDLGRFGFAASTFPAGQLTGDVRMRGINLDLVGSWPLTERLSLLGRAGLIYAQSRGSFGAAGAVSNPYGVTSRSERDWGLKLGAGIGWQLSPAWQLRAELERYRISDSVGNKGNVDVASISLVYRFGASGSMQRVATTPGAVPGSPGAQTGVPGAAGTMSPPPGAAASTAPSPAAAGTAPSPSTAPAAPAAPTTRVQFSADALFDFDQATLRPEGQRQLDAFAQRLRGVRVDGVLVTGHSDRIGSTAYNLRLSERRAAAVQAHLVQAGVAAATISIRGAGETQPVTTPADCKGNQPTPALVACLQPDRRVEVEATGTR
ncbi:outer membrane beta-barrel protein [Caenimonas sedimenti]|uniref:Outer membrane beta-barrel protein n=2 Tax=Caenimonas sedimenti TaxID=2596921 RepID=A0A562ZQS3_9BURK|nr:outer membrane beta-barrel protein [Caenimonas sedimenti]